VPLFYGTSLYKTKINYLGTNIIAIYCYKAIVRITFFDSFCISPS
jgi:hypothetical protein